MLLSIYQASRLSTSKQIDCLASCKPLLGTLGIRYGYSALALDTGRAVRSLIINTLFSEYTYLGRYYSYNLCYAYIYLAGTRLGFRCLCTLEDETEGVECDCKPITSSETASHNHVYVVSRTYLFNTFMVSSRRSSYLPDL